MKKSLLTIIILLAGFNCLATGKDAPASEWAGSNPESEGPKKEQFWMELCDKLHEEGYDIHYINMHGPRNNPDNPLEGSSAFGSTEGTVDGGHLTDLGFLYIARYLYDTFNKIP